MFLFDLDGTLLDSNGVWTDIDHAFLGRHGLTPTEEYCHTVGHSIFPVAAQYTKDYYQLDMTPEEIMEEWLSMARDAYANTIPLKPGVRKFLDLCASVNDRMALVTSCVPELCHAALDRLGLSNTFEQIIFAQELGVEKRDPEFLRRACVVLQMDPVECILCDDAPENCAAGRMIGMTVVGVHDSFYESRQEELQKICHRYIHSFDDLL